MKTIVMSFFVILSAFFTGFIYNQWNDQSSDKKFSEIIELSHETTIIQKTYFPLNERLVPKGALLTTNDVYTVYYIYTINTNENYNLKVSLENACFVKNETKYFDLSNLLNFDFNIEKDSLTKTTVTISISLNEPKDKSEYDIISESQISFTLIFYQEEY